MLKPFRNSMKIQFTLLVVMSLVLFSCSSGNQQENLPRASLIEYPISEEIK